MRSIARVRQSQVVGQSARIEMAPARFGAQWGTRPFEVDYKAPGGAIGLGRKDFGGFSMKKEARARCGRLI
jgi:hypothetical protein